MANKSKGRGEGGKQRPAQTQAKQPGRQNEMTPEPIALPDDWGRTPRLAGQVALITGGDSGIGRSVAVAFARQGADVAVAYLEEQADAEETKRLVEAEGRKCLLLKGDVGRRAFCDRAVEKTVKQLGSLSCLVNNAAEQHPQDSIEDITDEQLLRTFKTNIFAMFYLSRAAVPHLKAAAASGPASVINSTSVTAYRGSPGLLDYSSTKGAIVTFTRSLSGQLATDGVRVNAVAPGPIWTPLIPATFPGEKVETFGSQTPMERAGQPWELAGAYVYLASRESTYVTGQVIHVNGGEVVGG